MRIAVILETELREGGGFQHELTIASLLNRKQNVHQFIFYAISKETVRTLQRYNVPISFLNMQSLMSRLFLYAQKSRILSILLDPVFSSMAPFEKVLHRDRIDLVYYPAPSWTAVYLRRLHYVLTAWDQNHRDDPEFPEVNFNREFIDRDNFFKNTVPRAVAVLVDAKESKENLVKRYGCDAQRVHVAPFLPSLDIGKNPDIDLKKKYGIARKYIFYPAQFWAHKNHVYILDGLNILRQKHGIEIDAVFSGSDKGKNLKYVLSYAGKLGLGDAIHYVGFVPNEDMSSFYRQSIALVMPTYLGPTNIPPLEAFVLGCPVCYSDLPGLRDQVGDAAFLMDLKDPASMAKQVATILNDKKLVQQKIAKGKAIVAGWTEDDYWNVLKDIFESYRVKQHCWKDSGVS